MHHGRRFEAPQRCARDALLLMRAMVVRWRHMTATVVMALAQKRGGTPKIDVAPKQRHKQCATGAESTHHEGQSLKNYYQYGVAGPRRWKAAMVSSRWKWAHRRGNGGTRREFLVISPQSDRLTQDLSTRSGGRKLVTMPTFLVHAGDSRPGAQKQFKLEKLESQNRRKRNQ